MKRRCDRPTCFMAYTIKRYGLPFAGHKDNHSGLMSREQIDRLRRDMNIPEGEEWDRFAGLPVSPGELSAFLASVPFNQAVKRNHHAARIAIPAQFAPPPGANLSTQQGFGRLLLTLAREHPDVADRIVTTAPDVTVSTNLGGWINARGVFSRNELGDAHSQSQIVSPQKWVVSPRGQHIELGIAESSFFSLLAALGLAAPLFGTRLLDRNRVRPFIARRLDVLNCACYQDARWPAPSGITLAPERRTSIRLSSASDSQDSQHSGGIC